MSASIPSVLVSSTFYDLRQVRADLGNFLTDQMGYYVLKFEDGSFPIDPDVTTIENCRRRVEDQADILLLIVGGRYGSINKSTGKSVTNIEYLAARAKGIPIYVFLDGTVLAHYENWLQNSANTFAGQIDNPQLFEFIKTIRDEHKTWISSFASAQDITDSLRHQFAFLLKASLADRMRLKEQDVSDELKGLRGRALRLALERPPGWEHRLFSQLLNNAINDHADLRLDFEKKFVVGKGRHVGPTDTQWMLEMMAETWPIVEQLGQLIDHDFRDAIGPPGNIGKIRYVADRLAKIHLVALEWSQEVRRTYAHRIMIEAKEGLAEMTTDIVQKIEQIAGEFNKQLSDVEQKIERGEKIEIKLMLSLRLNGLEKFKSGMQLLQARIERGEHLR